MAIYGNFGQKRNNFINLPSSIVLLNDYQMGLDSVTFDNATQNQLECVTLLISADEIPEAPENLTVVLSSTDPEVTIDPTRNMATIIITDNREFYLDKIITSREPVSVETDPFDMDVSKQVLQPTRGWRGGGGGGGGTVNFVLCQRLWSSNKTSSPPSLYHFAHNYLKLHMQKENFPYVNGTCYHCPCCECCQLHMTSRLSYTECKHSLNHGILI